MSLHALIFIFYQVLKVLATSKLVIQDDQLTTTCQLIITTK